MTAALSFFFVILLWVTSLALPSGLMWFFYMYPRMKSS
jgi:hypothetical protein